MRNILIFSNPFGYGPTGKAICIAKEFINRFPNSNIIFVSSSFAVDIIPSEINTFNLNERNEIQLFDYLKKFDKNDTFIFSSQNRFPIKVAKTLNIKNAFLDGLAWFWHVIPEDHFIADDVFWLKYPGIEKIKDKYNNFKDKIYLIHGIVEKSIKDKLILDKNYLLINIGGVQNPLKNGIQNNYFKLLGFLLYNLSNSININMCVTGNRIALDYIKNIYDFNNKILFKSMSHNDFILELEKTHHFITIAGQTATIEAFSLNKPTSFLLPMFQSQYGLTEYLKTYIDNINELKWGDYIKDAGNLYLNSELESMDIIEKYSEIIISDSELKNKVYLDFVNLINTIPDVNKQNLFMAQVGSSGAREIVDILSKKWKL